MARQLERESTAPAPVLVDQDRSRFTTTHENRYFLQYTARETRAASILSEHRMNTQHSSSFFFFHGVHAFFSFRMTLSRPIVLSNWRSALLNEGNSATASERSGENVTRTT